MLNNKQLKKKEKVESLNISVLLHETTFHLATHLSYAILNNLNNDVLR